MSHHVERRAILFADISGSTALYDTLGNEAAKNIISRTLEVLSGCCTAQGGTVIKTIGDEVMCSFPAAEAAFEAACAMQQAMESGVPGVTVPVRIHVGAHFGEVICEQGDVHGDAVNVAARITEVSRAREIIVSQDLVEALPEKLRGSARQIFRGELRGKQEEVGLYRVAWEMDETVLSTASSWAARTESVDQDKLVLQYDGRSYTFDASHKQVTLGREDECEIVIPHFRVSRTHATVEYRSGKFVLIDRSSNGTYIRYKDGHVVCLIHEETVLHGSGSISLGQAFDDPPMLNLVEFHVLHGGM
jgi:adenylate cyclase